MVKNLVFRWPKPKFFMVLGAHGIPIFPGYHQPRIWGCISKFNEHFLFRHPTTTAQLLLWSSFGKRQVQFGLPPLSTTAQVCLKQYPVQGFASPADWQNGLVPNQFQFFTIQLLIKNKILLWARFAIFWISFGHVRPWRVNHSVSGLKTIVIYTNIKWMRLRAFMHRSVVAHVSGMGFFVLFGLLVRDRNTILINLSSLRNLRSKINC